MLARLLPSAIAILLAVSFWFEEQAEREAEAAAKAEAASSEASADAGQAESDIVAETGEMGVAAATQAPAVEDIDAIADAAPEGPATV